MAGEKRGFALKASVEDFAGGSFAYGEGLTFDLKAALDEGKGTIVTDDPQVIAVLQGHDLFKAASVKEESEKLAPTPAPSAQGAGESTSTTPGKTGSNGS